MAASEPQMSALGDWDGQWDNEKLCASFSCATDAMHAGRPRPKARKVCMGCNDADPPTRYCDVNCQRSDWVFHRDFCRKIAYCFEIELLGSRNPVITRTVDVPSWYTFEELHFVIQYAFGPWQCRHLHEFQFPRGRANPNRSGAISLDLQVHSMRVGPKALFDGDVDVYAMPGMPKRSHAKPMDVVENETLLSDVYDPSGKLRSVVEFEGEVPAATYLYHFGDNWEHLVTFKGAKRARAARPLFSSAVGYGPAEDCGGVTGWEEIKRAYAAARPSADQRRQREWALDAMGKRGRDDPLAVEGGEYSPLKTPNVAVMNYEGRWENHLDGYREDEKQLHYA